MANPGKSHKKKAAAAEPADAEAPSAEPKADAEAPSGDGAAEAAPSAEAAARGSKRARPAESHTADEIAFPASSVARIVKACIPDSMQLSKDARTAFGRAATIFALYVTSCANDLCRDGKRSTISATDVYKALDELEFESFTPQVKEFVEAFRTAQATKKGKSEAGSAREQADADPAGEDGEPVDEPAAKNGILTC
ncbi:histone-fold-containing protein [Pavlovales sp. CCMP2436]|nr:histone-fold-containing protein [Pavlovales sp. CCMP2436]